ncbi:MAG: phage tail assembly chaperone [Rhodobacteraceae bacterium]|jgi:uncharacterized phage protein (TIGR02216 family)|uniref:Phage tail assembly chaperone n=1 Tax=Salipiger profundus TaxID=1229727 RepID=A0A1U7CZZ2_9RHOB|nr:MULTISPECIES: rcc01693 family protein [Salipiger]APX21413.1 phage conserved hypothetical protein [Salipiger profundus]MAB08823.1 phage tail assembly chaperone [Paracoccaceae bacterium]GGA02546.1 hypothetical protein GCM10011326_12370 [Salipiger profundus]SFC21866.1 phage conserved hypothetical protein [Salipiger profundus]
MDGAFHWQQLLRAGLRGLGLTPEQFWSLTPAELKLMLGDDSGIRPLGRSRLEEMMRAFPDGRAGASRTARKETSDE